MIQKKNNHNGITLVALVVTIIVLLILSGVTINLVLGNNGIIKKAFFAKELTKQKEEEERNIMQNLLEEMNNQTGTVPKVEDTTPGDITDGGNQDGSEATPYKIQSVEDLVSFMKQGETNKYTDKVISLETVLDINSPNSYVDSNNTTFGDLNGDTVVSGLLEELTNRNGTGMPAAEEFEGVLNGNGKEIKNYYRKMSRETSNGIIRDMNSQGIVRDLSVQGELVFEISNVNNPWVRTGTLIGENDGLIENCKTSINLVASQKNLTSSGNYVVYVGTIAGSNMGTINLCENRGSIEVQHSETCNTDSEKIQLGIGGISGYNAGTIINTINRGNVKVSKNSYGASDGHGAYVSGIVGFAHNNTVIENVYNVGNIEITADRAIQAGGIVGSVFADISSIKVENVFNSGTITATAGMDQSSTSSELILGGCIGNAYGNRLSKLFNIGNLIDKSNTKTTLYGGLVGNKHSNTFPDSYYLASVAPYGVEAGELTAEVSGVTRVNDLSPQQVIEYLNQNVATNNADPSAKQWKKWKIVQSFVGLEI